MHTWQTAAKPPAVFPMQEEVSTTTFRPFPEGMELGGGPVSRRLEQAELDQVLARVIGGLEERKQAVELSLVRA